MIATEDSELLALVHGGDRDALAALYSRYSPIAYAVALRVLKSPASAEDLLQELFLQFWGAPECVCPDQQSLYGWIVVVSRNRAISMLRKKRFVPLQEVPRLSFIRQDDRAQCKLMCDRLIGTVTTGSQLLLRMAFYQDMTHSEIAEQTGIPLGTVKTRIRSALAVMKKLGAA